MFQRTKNKNIISPDFVPAQPLYLSNDRMNVQKIFDQIRKGRKLRFLHFIVRSEKEGELFVIYSAQELLLPVYEGRRFEVVGIGRGKKDTYRLLERIIMDILASSDKNQINVDHYFNP